MNEQLWAADTAMHYYEEEEQTNAQWWRKQWLKHKKKGETCKTEQSTLNMEKEELVCKKDALLAEMKKIQKEAEEFEVKKREAAKQWEEDLKARRLAEEQEKARRLAEEQEKARQDAEKRAHEKKNERPKEWDNAIKTCKDFHRKNGFPMNNYSGDGFVFDNLNITEIEQEVFKLRWDSSNGHYVWCTLCSAKLFGMSTFMNHRGSKCHTSKFGWYHQEKMWCGSSTTHTEWKSTTTTNWGPTPTPPPPPPPPPAPPAEKYDGNAPKMVADAVKDLDFLAKQVEKILKFETAVTKSQVNDNLKELRKKYHPDKHPMNSQASKDADEASKILHSAAQFKYVRKFLSE